MNENVRVVRFAGCALALLIAVSAVSHLPFARTLSLHRISILSDVQRAPYAKAPRARGAGPAVAQSGTGGSDSLISPGPAASPLSHQRGGVLMRLDAPEGAQALPRLAARIAEVKRTGRGKVRIAWLGDSMIEGDLLTQTVRRLLQGYAGGGGGVGFVPARSAVAGFRTSVTHGATGWEESNFKSKSLPAPIGLSGRVFLGGGSISLTDKTVGGGGVLVKSLLCGPAPGGGEVAISVNGAPRTVSAPALLNRIVLDSSSAPDIKVAVEAADLPVYGISLEPASGVVVDNLSFRGISGVELGKTSADFLRAWVEAAPYDLVVLEYGANLMFRAKDTDYSWFENLMKPVLPKLRSAMPDAEFLIISTADRAFSYEGEWKTAVGMDSLLAVQARLARDNRTAWLNLYATMGGYGAIVRWADSTPALANRDYVHPNHKGAEVLGKALYEAFTVDFGKGSPEL